MIILTSLIKIFLLRLHHCTFYTFAHSKRPHSEAKGAVMSDEDDTDCAFSIRKGVNADPPGGMGPASLNVLWQRLLCHFKLRKKTHLCYIL
jgi:hypothetical protein